MAVGGGTSARPQGRRRWPYVLGGIVVLLGGLVALGLLVLYPRIGASKIREKLTAKADAFGRRATIGAVDVKLGRAVIRDVRIAGDADGHMPLVYIERIDVTFDAWASLVGRVELGEAKVDGVVVTLHRGADGRDNIRDLVDQLRARKDATTPTDKPTLPTKLTVTRGKLQANDAVTGATLTVGDGDASWIPGELVATGRAITAVTRDAPHASAATIVVTKKSGTRPEIAIEGGEVAIWPKLALSGITGTVSADGTLALAGGYGGVAGKLWTAKGTLDPSTLAASLDLEADKFQLARLAPLLEKSAVVDYQETSIDTRVHIDVDRGGARFAGTLNVRGLNVGHPMIADREVHGLDLLANVAGAYDRATRRLELTRGDFTSRNVPFSITGVIARPILAMAPEGAPPVLYGPHGLREVHLRLVIPPVDCQRMLGAFPEEMAPYLAGYKLRGVFDTDVRLDIDWANLDATVLDGHVGIKHCKVIGEPSDSPKRLKEEFEHYVEVEKGQWLSFVVGPSNEDFVPIEDISPFLIKSIMSTEDNAFYKHKGFIVSEFRTALVSDLKAGAFRHGASSITMQMVKNVLLYREKTLARKLQELFLTWHVENTLAKDRILEIYLNVIEYGPGLYGIGPATKHFFGKPPAELDPVEAAFFSTILPSPKERYKQYCQGTLTKWTSDKIERILGIMLKRERLTQAEYDTATITPLRFQKDSEETEEDCMKRVKKAIKNARPTNPLKR